MTEIYEKVGKLKISGKDNLKILKPWLLTQEKHNEVSETLAKNAPLMIYVFS